MACVRDVVFSADTGVLKTWLLSGWQLDQWLVRTHQGRPENLRLNRGTIHHGVNERHVKTRVKAIYATFYPLGKCESQRAGKLPTGATVLFTCSDEKVIVWKVLRSGPRNMNIDLKEMYEIKIRSADSDCEVFTGLMACTNPHRGSQWSTDAAASSSTFTEEDPVLVHSVPKIAHRDRPHLFFATMKLRDKGSEREVIGIWNLSSDHKVEYIRRLETQHSGKIYALNFGPFANGPLVASTSFGNIRMWQAPFKGEGRSLFLEGELDNDTDPKKSNVCGHVMGLANEPNLELWSKNEIDSHPRRVNIRPPEI